MAEIPGHQESHELTVPALARRADAVHFSENKVVDAIALLTGHTEKDGE